MSQPDQHAAIARMRAACASLRKIVAEVDGARHPLSHKRIKRSSALTLWRWPSDSYFVSLRQLKAHVLYRISSPDFGPFSVSIFVSVLAFTSYTRWPLQLIKS